MIQLVLLGLLGGGVLWYFLHVSEDKKSRIVGSILILAGVLCFALYSYGILGVGLSSFILDLFGKAGVIS